MDEEVKGLAKALFVQGWETWMHSTESLAAIRAEECIKQARGFFKAWDEANAPEESDGAA